MEFKIEVGNYETIFSSFEIFKNIEENRIIFNLLELTPKEYKIFSESTQKEIFLDEKNGIIACRCIDHSLQFALLITETEEMYFSHYFDDNGEIGFSAKSEIGEQYNKATIFQHT